MRDILLSKETRYMKDYDFTNLKQKTQLKYIKY